MRLGVFGGTFDPIHLGHLILAEGCREACSLDRVLFVVAGVPPHKSAGRTSINHRLEMARIATAGHESFEVSEVEAKGSGPHYSFETLAALHDSHPADDLFFLIGADSLVDLPGWRHPERIAELATLVVANRPGVATPPTPDFVPAHRPMLHVSIPPIGISSHDLRARMAEGRSVRYQVPRGVEAYIREEKLYSASL